MSTHYDGKTVIVTGAARGIGRAVAGKLIELGANVMLTDPDDQRLAEVKVDLPDKQGLACFACDISQKFGVSNLIAATLDAFERIDALITTACEVERADALSLSMDALDRILATNFRGAFLLSQAVAQKMIARAEARGAGNGGRDGPPRSAGAIVHVSAISGRVATPGFVANGLAYAATDHLTRSLAIALADKGIRVNGVAPGGVMTSTLRSAIADDPDLRAALLARTPLGRIGDAEEAAEAALFLASERASFITGQILVVDGGRSVLDPLQAANV
ncbi:MAG: SDR family oxidoreductase [Pseudomonadota bacterium]